MWLLLLGLAACSDDPDTGKSTPGSEDSEATGEDSDTDTADSGDTQADSADTDTADSGDTDTADSGDTQADSADTDTDTGGDTGDTSDTSDSGDDTAHTDAADSTDSSDPDTGDDGVDSGDSDSGDSGTHGDGTDTGVPDSGVPDTGVPDSGVPDTDVPDSGVPDSGVPDSGVRETGVPDTGVPDTGADSATEDERCLDGDTGLCPEPDTADTSHGGDSAPFDTDVCVDVDSGPCDSGAPDSGGGSAPDTADGGGDTGADPDPTDSADDTDGASIPDTDVVDPDPADSDVVDPDPADSDVVDPDPADSDVVDPDPTDSDVVDPDTALPPDTGPTDSSSDSADSSPDSGADTGADTAPTEEACVPSSDSEVTLCADRFWAQELDPVSQAEVEAAIAAMPVELQDEALSDPVDRARQLQWAVVAANALTAASVTVLLPDGTYDFTGLDEPHPSVPATDFYQLPLLPKLFVHHHDLTLRRATESAEPVLTASGPGADGVHHGRVFLLLDSSYTGLVVEGLTFRGDAEPSTFTDSAWALHENDDSLYFTGQWGMAMVGLNGGANHASFTDCRFEQVNGNAISAVGLLTVTSSVFEGAVPEAEDSDPEPAVEALYAAITAERGSSPGMDFHSGIRRAYAYGPTVVEDSSFTGFVQGLLASADGFAIEVGGSSFSSIYDHAIYVLGDAGGSVIADNLFERVGNGAVKFAGSTTETDPELCVAGLHDGVIRDNVFSQMRNGAITFGGVFNEISGNEVSAYDASADPTGWYDPFYRPGHHYPEVFLITEAGQAGWADHIYGNSFVDNSSGDGDFSMLIQQRTTIPDRSISENTVSGAGQTVYFHHLRACADYSAPCSDYTPTITVESGATLVLGAPEDCADCYPELPFYISALP